MNPCAKLSQHKHLFENLICIDVLLTNKCNLRCSYCYQQHIKDDGYYTQENMRDTWDWLKGLNNKKGKKLQFFGGEPMLHKDFIIEFVRLNRDEYLKSKGIMTTSIVSNGLFFDRDFLEEYLEIGTTEVNFSIDTINPSLCDRGLNSKQINKILDSISTACFLGSSGMIAARINITPKNYRGFKELFYELYERGMRRFWFHPITHSFEDGNLNWTDEVWNDWRQMIKEILDDELPMDHFTIAEGVGKKRSQEFYGVRDIAMDASGDFTSCYVWISTKEEILGNIFRDELNLDLYLGMETEHNQMIKTDPLCLNCNRNNLCYQFHSGNKNNYGQRCYANETCGKIVDLYIETGAYLNNIKIKKKLANIISSYQKEGEIVIKRALIFLIDFYLKREGLTKNIMDVPTPPLALEELKELQDLDLLPKDSLTLFLKQILLSPLPLKEKSLKDILKTAASLTSKSEETSIKEIYHSLANKLCFEIPSRTTKKHYEDFIYLAMLHFLILGQYDCHHFMAFGGYE